MAVAGTVGLSAHHEDTRDIRITQDDLLQTFFVADEFDFIRLNGDVFNLRVTGGGGSLRQDEDAWCCTPAENGDTRVRLAYDIQDPPSPSPEHTLSDRPYPVHLRPDAGSTVTLTVSTNDGGNTGSPGARITTDVVDLNIPSDNTAPVAGDDVLPTNEDTVLRANLLLASAGAHRGRGGQGCIG